MVKSNFENVLQKGVAIELQMSSLSEESVRRSNSYGSGKLQQQISNLNINQRGSMDSPKNGDMLLFAIQMTREAEASQEASNNNYQYQACGFPKFTLDKRAMIDI